MKNPEHAQAYNKQMAKMSEMEVSQNLAEKEVVEYKGPFTTFPITLYSDQKAKAHQCTFLIRQLYSKIYWMKGPTPF